MLENNSQRTYFLLSEKSRQEGTSKIAPFINIFRKSTTVLDIGCGSGIELKFLITHCNCWTIGIDIDEKALKLAKLRLKNANVELIRADALRPPFRFGIFDTAICLDVLEHLVKPYALIKIVGNILRKEGYFILRVPNKYTIHVLLLIFSPITKRNKNTWYVRHVYFFDAKKLITTMENYGFRHLYGYSTGSLLHNSFNLFFTISSILTILFRFNTTLRFRVLSKFVMTEPKPKVFGIKSRMPSFSYLTMLFRLVK